jgi:hypothetical protein
MSDEPTVDDLARRYLDLWQEQMRALASDPEFVDMLDRLTGMMGPAAMNAAMTGYDGNRPANPWTIWPAAMMAMMSGSGGYGRTDGGWNAKAEETRADGGQGADGGHRTGHAGARSAAGSAPAAAASERGADDVDELAARVAALEERIASLEATLRAGGGGAKTRARKRRS